MRRDQFEQFVSSIFDAQDQEILCGEFFERLPRFVEIQSAGQDAGAVFPEVQHHLGQCPECHEVYLALLDAVGEDTF